eukprot:12770294-Alexandrium_andersonii.AAC.1
MKGIGHDVLATHLAVNRESLMTQGTLVLHGRELWRDIDIARDGMRLKWEVRAVFKVLNTLKDLANFLQLFCQFHGIPQRDPRAELAMRAH